MTHKFISFDWAMKKLLRSKANFGILAGFLSELLFTDITIVEILESDKETSDNKFNRVDIKVRDADNQLILIEIYYSREMDFLLRILSQTPKHIAEHLDQKLICKNTSKLISINILYYDFCEDSDYIYHGSSELIGLHNHTVLKLNPARQRLFSKKTVCSISPERYMININNFDDKTNDTLDEWIYFFKNIEIKDNFQAKGLLEAKEKLDVLKLNASDKAAYNRHQKDLRHEASNYQSTYILGRIEGKEKRLLQQQRQQDKADLVLNMRSNGLNIQDIAKFTGYSEGEIKSLLD